MFCELQRICNFLIHVKAEQEKIYLFPFSRKTNIETLIFVFQTQSEMEIPLVRQGLEKQHFLDQTYQYFTDACNNCDRQKRYDKYDPREHCYKGKLAAHLSQNHIVSANKYSFLQLINLKFVWFGFCLVQFCFLHHFIAESMSSQPKVMWGHLCFKDHI